MIWVVCFLSFIAGIYLMGFFFSINSQLKGSKPLFVGSAAVLIGGFFLLWAALEHKADNPFTSYLIRGLVLAIGGSALGFYVKIKDDNVQRARANKIRQEEERKAQLDSMIAFYQACVKEGIFECKTP